MELKNPPQLARPKDWPNFWEIQWSKTLVYLAVLSFLSKYNLLKGAKSQETSNLFIKTQNIIKNVRAFVDFQVPMHILDTLRSSALLYCGLGA